MCFALNIMTITTRSLQSYCVILTIFLYSSFVCADGTGLRTDSRAPFVHTITVFDKDGEKIDYKDKFEARPFSQDETCGKCHKVAEINHGWHFNANDPEVNKGRAGEPWIWVDANTRTALPLSYRQWNGTWKPEDAGIDTWMFTRRFGRHFPGGGVGVHVPKDEDDIEGRWHISGNLNNDCLSCHSASAAYDGNERADQIEKENFLWSATAAAGLAKIVGDTVDIPLDFDPEFPEMSEAKLPLTKFEQSRFKGDGLVYFDIVRKPVNERCYHCHSGHSTDASLPPAFQQDEDIHIAAGMNCTDCHRHGLDHMVSRSYEGEEQHSKAAAAGTLTCRSCHIEEQGNVLTMGGRLGAPIAKHEGLPLIHLDMMSCTACHSGPWPQKQTTRVQTAMAHFLGVSDEYRVDNDPPYITQPVFLGGHDGKITPHKMMFPSFWGKLKDDVITPVPIETVDKYLKSVLKTTKEERKEFPRGWKPVKNEDLAKGLAKLQSKLKDGETAVYIKVGKAFKLEGEKIAAFDNKSAEPYAWPLAHNVRGAGQSLGVRDCTDCHADDSSFFWGEVALDAAETSGVLAAATWHDMHHLIEATEKPSAYAWVAKMFTMLIIVTMTLLLAHIFADIISRLFRKKHG